MSEEMEWGDPPAETRASKTASWRAKAEVLRRNPGRWAIVHRAKAPLAAAEFASRLRLGKVKAFGLHFEASTDDTVIYARFVGEGCE